MFNCYGEPVDLAQLNNWQPASMSGAGKISCHSKSLDLTQHADESSARGRKTDQLEVADGSAPEVKQQPWWYRLLVPSDSGAVATLGGYATADVTTGCSADDAEDEDALASKARELVVAKPKTNIKFDFDHVTVVGKSILDWEPEPEVAAPAM